MTNAEQTLPIRFDLTGEDAIIQGSYWRREFGFFHLDGTIWDTVGFSAEMKVRRSIGGAQVLYLDNWSNGRLEVGVLGTVPDQYNLAMALSHSVTEGIDDWGEGVYQVEMIDTLGRRIRVLEGYCTLSREVNY